MTHKLPYIIKHRRIAYENALQKLIDGKVPVEYVCARKEKLKQVLKPRKRRR